MQRQKSLRKLLAAAAAALAVCNATVAGEVAAQRFAGSIGSSPQWGSAWIDLASPVDLEKGEKLRIKLGGSAEKVLVRLLPKGASPDADTGIVGGPISVAQGRIIEIIVLEPKRQIVQITVHGGPNPWGRYPLGAANGPVTVVWAERVKP